MQTTRTGPTVAATTRDCGSSTSSDIPRSASAGSRLERMATPLYVFCPWTTAWYPAARSSSAGNCSSVHLSSWTQSTSGWADASHARSRSVRARIELMFQVAIFTAATSHERRLQRYHPAVLRAQHLLGFGPIRVAAGLAVVAA